MNKRDKIEDLPTEQDDQENYRPLATPMVEETSAIGKIAGRTKRASARRLKQTTGDISPTVGCFLIPVHAYDHPSVN